MLNLRCSTSPRSRSRSATRSGGSAASSPATATTASLGRAVGDGLSRRHRADHRGGPPDPGLRDAQRWAASPACSGACATASGRACCSPSTWCSPGLERFLVEFVRRNDEVALGLTQAAADQPRDDRRGRVWMRSSAAAPDRCGRSSRTAAQTELQQRRRRAGSRSRSGRRRARSRGTRRGRRTPRACPSRRAGTSSRGASSTASIEPPAVSASRSVANRPVAIVFTVTPSAATSRASVLKKPTAAGRWTFESAEPGDQLAGRGRADVDDPAPAALAHAGQRPPRSAPAGASTSDR